ncbi:MULTISPECIES: phospholipase D family protein [Nocardia]|uniref:Phospholipase D family protein n=1 Tax=Nocardia elegans TaxID=300029 RepID=A0ABW6TD10_9NOCA|nr:MULTISPECIES: phospholipase D family protein [Nocardia]MBF6446197.1 phospholipase D family protein [Nocardia elegans]
MAPASTGAPWWCSHQFWRTDPWPEITRALPTPGPRSAAIAYLGDTANELLPLRGEDILIVNAGSSALRAHATSPESLRDLLGRGVEIYSSPRLHAKVAATQTVAVIGSANASHHSTTIDEAVVISDYRELIRQVHAFVAEQRSRGLDLVDDSFIDWAQTEWDRGKPSPLIGVASEPVPTQQSPLQSLGRLFILDVEYWYSSDTESEFEKRNRRRVRRSVPAATYQLEWLRLSKLDQHYHVDDIVLFRYEDEGEEWISPPHVVVSEGRLIPRSRGAVGCHLRYRPELEPVLVSDAAAHLAAAGLAPSLNPGCLRRPERRDVLLSLWREF